MVGTPAYLPPELIRGEVGQAGPAGDVYALGVTLHRLLTGQLPFAGTPFHERLQLQGSLAPRPASEVAGRPLPPELAELCAQALLPDPAQRPTASEVAERLEAWVSTAPPDAGALDLPTPAPAPNTTTADSGARVQAALEAARALITSDVVRVIRDLAGPAPKPPEAEHPLPLPQVLARVLAIDLDLHQALEVTLDLVLTATGAPEGLILLADDEGRFTIEHARGVEADGLPPPVSTTVLRTLAGRAEPLLVLDALSDARFAGQRSVADAKLRSLACVPLHDPGDDELLGALYLQDRTRPGRFSEATRELLLDLAHLIAPPLARARRYGAERRAAAACAAPELRPSSAPPRLIGQSPALERALRLVSRASQSDAPVLVLGESGTGKELVARHLHALSPRRQGPFVAESCAAFAESLVEAELFGVVKGAYTGADADRPGLFREADGGTLFLDEVGELSLPCQGKLLRALQEGEVRPLGSSEPVRVDVRLVTATHKDLSALAREGAFREDLLYRLNVVPVRLPALHERVGDLPLLVDHFLEELGGAPDAISTATRARLQAHAWPGNVRELRNAVQRLLTLGDDGAPWLGEAAAATPRATSGQAGLSVDLDHWTPLPALRDARVEFDRVFLSAVLDRHGWNITAAAQALQIGRSNLSRLLKRLGLRAPA
jgi:transcriptional regulator with GAF, ATPase, and Fis domain